MAKHDARNESVDQAGNRSKSKPSPSRIVSLDALRGFDMFWIMGGPDGGGNLVLAAAACIWGSAPPWLEHQLEHVPWEGFVAWDLIMPLFLFVVGAAMPFSFSRRLDEGQSKGGLYWKIVRRTLILFVLGMMVQGHLLDFKLSTLHLYCNTLQAIAAGYLVAGVVMLNAGVAIQFLVALLLLIIYWLLLRFVPFDGHAAGTLEQNANLALAVDKFILGRYIDGTQPPYTWILSSLGFAATTLLGVMSGHVLRSTMKSWQKLLVLLSAGLACLGAGWAWAEWGGLPIIKHIWTSSMVLWAAGWSFLLLAFFYLFTDAIGWRRWVFPLVVIGMNAITIYVANRFIPFYGISESLVSGAASHAGPAAERLIVQLTATSLAWLFLYYLYRHKVFVRI